MQYANWAYFPNGVVNSFPYLGSTFAHPGGGISNGEAQQRFAISAYTVPESGVYSITNSLVARNSPNGDGIEVSVHVNDQPVTQLLSLGTAPNGTSGDFNTNLGQLTAGDTIYVGIGPDGPGGGDANGADGVAWDFSISVDDSSQPDPPVPGAVEVSIDLDTQRFIGDVSSLDRSKFFKIHSGASDSDINTFRSDYDVSFGRQFWGALPYAKSQTGQVGVYPNITPSTDQTVRPSTDIVHTGHPRDALRWDTDVQAAADWVTTYYTTVVNTVPEFLEPMNEPFVTQVLGPPWNCGTSSIGIHE